MRSDVLGLIPAFAVIVAVAMGLALWTERAEPAPEFTLEIIAGEGVGDRVSLSNLRGEVVVLEFWASWCSACRRSVPTLNELQARIPELQIYGITSEGLPPAQLRDAHFHFGFDFPALRDDQGLAQAFGVEALPTLVIIDAEGRVQWHHMGTITSTELLEQLQPFVDIGDAS